MRSPFCLILVEPIFMHVSLPPELSQTIAELATGAGRGPGDFIPNFKGSGRRVGQCISFGLSFITPAKCCKFILGAKLLEQVFHHRRFSGTSRCHIAHANDRQRKRR